MSSEELNKDNTIKNTGKTNVNDIGEVVSAALGEEIPKQPVVTNSQKKEPDKKEETSKEQESGWMSQLWSKFTKSDGILKMLAGAGVVVALTKLIRGFGDDDDEFLDSFKRTRSKKRKDVNDKLKKIRRSSDTLVSRISNAMQQRNVENRMAGFGVAMTFLAQLSIKTQEGLSVILDSIDDLGAAQLKLFNNVKEEIEESNSSSIFESLFPVLISGMMVAVASFFIGEKGKAENKGKSFIDILLGKITGSLWDKVLPTVEKYINDVKSFIQENGEGLIKSVINYSIEKVFEKLDFSEKEIKNLKKVINDISELNIISVHETLKTVSTNLKGINENLTNIKGYIKQLFDFFGLNKSPTGEEDEAKKKAKSLWDKITYIAEKVKQGLEFSKNIEKFLSAVKNGLELLSNNDTIKAFTKITKWISEGDDSFGEKIRKELEGPLTRLISNVIENTLNNRQLFSNLENKLISLYERLFRQLKVDIFATLNKLPGLYNITEDTLRESLVDLIKNGDKSASEVANEFLDYFSTTWLGKSDREQAKEAFIKAHYEAQKRKAPPVEEKSLSVPAPKINAENISNNYISQQDKVYLTDFVKTLKEDRDKIIEVISRSINQNSIMLSTPIAELNNVSSNLTKSISSLNEEVGKIRRINTHTITTIDNN